MLTKLGNIIEKKPWFVVILVILITIGFSIFIPSLEFKTDFKDFMPDDEFVQANTRILDYFGMNKQIMLLYAEKQKSESVITPQSLRELDFIQKELEKIPEVNGTIAITTFIETVCQVEFGKTLENCTDDQIQTALQDLLMESEEREIQILKLDDPNEPIDYNRYPHISKGKEIDSADIKNCYLSKDNETIMFSIEVYDLSDFQSTLKPPFPRVNMMEWYIGFENLIVPDERLDIKYQIAAHIEPTYPIWELGRGILGNIREIFQNIRNRELFNSYKKEAYLWVKPPEQTMFFPMPLKTGDITFDTNENRINIVISRDELRSFGIAPQFGSFELPAKLTSFNAGVRYYQIPGLKLPGGRIIANTSFLFNRIERIRDRPILGTIATRMLQKYGDITWEDYDKLIEMMEQTDLVPDTIALKDLENGWVQSDEAPDSGVSDTVFFTYPYLFDEIQVSALSFLSRDYELTKSPKATLVVVQVDFGKDFEEILEINRKIIKRIAELDEEFDYVSVEVTGEGVVNSQINELTSEANQIIAPAIFIIIMIILFIFFRRASYVFLPMLALVVSTIWLFGTMALLGIAFNVIAIALVPFFMEIL